MADPVCRREIIAASIRFIQAVEGRDISEQEAFAVYDRVKANAGVQIPSKTR